MSDTEYAPILGGVMSYTEQSAMHVLSASGPGDESDSNDGEDTGTERDWNDPDPDAIPEDQMPKEPEGPCPGCGCVGTCCCV